MKKEIGASLLELLLVIAIVSSSVFLVANLPNAFLLLNKSKHLSLAREIATKQIEDKRATSFTNLVNDITTINDSRINLLPFGIGSIVVADCDLQICTNGEQVKKITISISWKDNNQTQNITLNTLIAPGGVNQQ